MTSGRQTMTLEDLRALSDAATPGPWRASGTTIWQPSLEQALLLVQIVTRIGKLESRGDPVKAAAIAVRLIYNLGFRVVVA